MSNTFCFVYFVFCWIQDIKKGTFNVNGPSGILN